MFLQFPPRTVLKCFSVMYVEAGDMERWTCQVLGGGRIRSSFTYILLPELGQFCGKFNLPSWIDAHLSWIPHVPSSTSLMRLGGSDHGCHIQLSRQAMFQIFKCSNFIHSIIEMTTDTRSFPFCLIIAGRTHLHSKHTKMQDFSPVNSVLQLNALTFSEG